MTSNDTTNQSTAPVHIDNAIAAADVDFDFDRAYPDVGFQWSARSEALEEVRDGQIITDDKLRADRMTRALAAAAAINAPHEDWQIAQGTMVPQWISDLVDEAAEWVDANPEVTA